MREPIDIAPQRPNPVVHQPHILQSDQIHPVAHIRQPQVFVELQNLLPRRLAVVETAVLQQPHALRRDHPRVPARRRLRSASGLLRPRTHAQQRNHDDNSHDQPPVHNRVPCPLLHRKPLSYRLHLPTSARQHNRLAPTMQNPLLPANMGSSWFFSAPLRLCARQYWFRPRAQPEAGPAKSAPSAARLTSHFKLHT